IDLAISSFEIRVGDETWPAVPGTSDVDHIQIVLLDKPVQMDVDKVQARRCSPVTEKPRLDVLFAERFPQQWVVIKINLPDGEIIGGAPIGVEFLHLLFGEHAACHLGCSSILTL